MWRTTNNAFADSLCGVVHPTTGLSNMKESTQTEIAEPTKADAHRIYDKPDLIETAILAKLLNINENRYLRRKALTSETKSDIVALNEDGAPVGNQNARKYKEGSDSFTSSYASRHYGTLTQFTRNGTECDITKHTSLADRYGKRKKAVMTPQTIESVYDFAGEGCRSEFRDAEKLAKAFEGESKDWYHARGTAEVTMNDGSVHKAEVHWFENKSVGQCGWKLKYLDDDGKAQAKADRRKS